MKLDLVALASIVLLATPAAAERDDSGANNLQSSTPSAPSIELHAQPLFGSGTPAPFGWVSFAITLRNSGQAPVTGIVQIVSSSLESQQRAHVYAQSKFSVAPGNTLQLELPAHDAAANGLSVEARLDDGQLIAETDAGDITPIEPLLVDLNRPSFAGVLLRGTPILTRYVPTPYGRYSSPSLAVASLEPSPDGGSDVLPRYPAGYASATLVMTKSSRLLALDADQSAALVDWVLTGGSLALSIDHDADLQSPILVALVGGATERLSDAPNLGNDFLVPDPKQDDKYRRGATELTVSPSNAVEHDLSIYGGGNLRPTPWGSAASYGLGEVHLLAFDPGNATHAADRWVQLKIESLTAYAWDRTAQIAFPIGSAGFEDHISDTIRSLLDSDRGEPWTLLIAGVIVLGYAIVIGPVNFYLARRSGRIFSALWRLPLLAGIASSAIVIIGIGKGSGGRSHRLTLIEAGAGMARGAAVRYRAFLSAQTETLTIAKTETNGLFDVIGPREPDAPVLSTSPEGVKLERFPNKPWQTLVVREDGLLDFGGGVSIGRDANELWVHNQTSHDLLAAILHLPGGELRFFRRIAAEQRITATDGEILTAGDGAAVRSLHALSLGTFSHELDRVAPGVGDAWAVIERATRRSIDWWPADVPVLLAELDASGTSRDSGVPVEADRTLIRVIGFGGQP